MQHSTKFGVDESKTMFIVINTERSLATAICKSAPYITFEIWRDQGHLFAQGKANEYLFGLIFVCARFETTG